ncbi:uncharacterized protein LOC100372703 [Saccoglossus kowalevskii]|uniref:Coiled-coil domain-containing protein 177-like n=1 Tax=Saccoglossus kowalevskii TaxID=10224 RepID=A0ABM0H1K1_SACKO|nr:PREDICTED: coiled-coil domain-containing protein 177-like [Saccoglossus kowalevskii]
MAFTTGMTTGPNYDVDDFFEEDNKTVDDYSKKLSRTPKLDLYNFDSPDAENNRYILTSPRSLEACSFFGIKPLELLEKTLEDFEDEYIPLGKSQKQIQRMYEEHDEDRKKKLKMCRNERERIILEDEESGCHRTRSSKMKSYTVESTPPKNKNTTYTTAEIRSGDAGSLQRKRTAWTTSIGHDRVSSEELDNRAREIYDSGITKDDSIRAREIYDSAITKDDSRPTSRPRRRARNTSDDPFAIRDKNKSFTPLKPRPSYSNASLSVTGNRSKLEISSAGLSEKYSTLSLGSLEAAHIQDRKIAELMKSKLAAEKEHLQQREMARLAWDEHQKEEQQRKLESEMQRRRNLAESQRDRERKMARLTKERKLAELSLIDDARRAVEFNELQSEKTKAKQQQMMVEKIHMKKRLDENRKRQQLHSKKSIEMEDKEFRQMVLQHSLTSLDKASKIKAIKDQNERMMIQQRNKHEIDHFKSKKAAVETMSVEELRKLAESLELKHSSASMKYEIQRQQRENLLLMNKMKKDDQFRRSREIKRDSSRQMEEWQEALLHHRNKVDEIATRKAAMTVEEKALRAREGRISKEKMQQQNLKKVQLDEEAWKRDTSDLLQIKEGKTKQLYRERGTSLERSRSAARASEDVRNRIRDEYTGGFDKMVEKANLQSRVGTGSQTAIKNISTVSLG